MDKKRSVLNISFAIFFKILIMIMAFVVRKFLCQYVGDEANGLNDLYGSIIGVLSVVELGAGSAIIFSMYKPIIENEKEKVAALYNFYKKIYLLIGAVVLVVGLIVTPFVPFMAKKTAIGNGVIYLTFLLMLGSTILSYMYAARSSLIDAHKNNFVTTLINSICRLLQDGIQLFVLYYTRSFIVFLIVKICMSAVSLLLYELYVRHKYKDIICNKTAVLDGQIKQEVTKNIKAMFLHKIGGALVMSMDNIIISAFLGVVLVGKYNNYSTIAVSLAAILTLFFTPITSIVGHYCVNRSSEDSYKLFKKMNIATYLLMFTSFLCLYSLFDEVINVIYGDSYVFSEDRIIPLIIVINYFVYNLRTPLGLFREAKGLFYYDRFKPLVEGILNLALSLIFVIFTKRVEGVIISTIITNIFICHVVEGHIVHKYSFNTDAKRHYIKESVFILSFILACGVMYFTHISNDNIYIQAILNLLVAIGISVVVIIISFIVSKSFRELIKDFIETFKKMIRRNAVKPNEDNN